MRRWWRWLTHRHDWILRIRHAHIDLYCPSCDTATPGWNLTPERRRR